MASQSRSSSTALALRVRYLLDVNRVAEALVAAGKATRHEPGSAPLHFLHGLALDRAGSPCEAARAFRRACYVGEAVGERGHAPSWYHLALLALDEGAIAVASEHFLAAVRACDSLDDGRPWPEWDDLTPAELKRLVVLHAMVDKRPDMGDVRQVEGNETDSRPGAGAAGWGLARRT